MAKQRTARHLMKESLRLRRAVAFDAYQQSLQITLIMLALPCPIVPMGNLSQQSRLAPRWVRWMFAVTSRIRFRRLTQINSDLDGERMMHLDCNSTGV
jgi:hypothetical protein